LRIGYDEALRLFEALEKSQDPHYRSYSFSLKARVFAELGEYRDALRTLNLGIADDIRTGNTAQRANKLFDIAYIEYKRHHYGECLKDARDALI